MRKFLLFVLLAALVLVPTLAQDEGSPRTGFRPDAPPYAIRGPHPVGVMEMAIGSVAPVDMVVWYPALNPDGITEETTYTYYDYNVSNEMLPVFGRALKDAAPTTGGPYPLVIFLHAGYQATISATYLTEHLASHGFVVLAKKHIDSGDWSVPRSLTMYSRLEDIPGLIEYGENLTSVDGTLAGLIDMERIALVGSGSGAEASLLAAGSRIDLNSPESICMLYPGMSGMCAESREVLLTRAGLDSLPDGLWPSWADPRIDAVIPLGSYARFLGPESLKDVTTPTLLMVPSVLMQLEQYRTYLHDNNGSTDKLFVVYEGATETIFHARCDRMPFLLSPEFYPFCSDPVWDMDRAHDLINHFTTAFLLAELKGDEDARAALAPDAVNFPGIGYEAVGY